MLKDRGPFVRAHTATALNFQITIALAFFGGWRPQYILAGSAFFAAMEVLAQRLAESFFGTADWMRNR